MAGPPTHLGCRESKKVIFQTWARGQVEEPEGAGTLESRVVNRVQPPPSSGKPSAGVALSLQARAAPPHAPWVTRRRGTPRGQEQQQDKLPHPTAQEVIRGQRKERASHKLVPVTSIFPFQAPRHSLAPNCSLKPVALQGTADTARLKSISGRLEEIKTPARSKDSNQSL